MSTFTTPELVAAVLSERRREATTQALARAWRHACERCESASSRFRRLLLRRSAETC